MIWPAVIAAALLALPQYAPAPPVARAEYIGRAIAAVTDDPDDAAALAVLAVREGGMDPRVEHCIKLGRGGAGAWQLNPRWHGWVIPCSHPISQAYGALDELYVKGWATYRRGALQGYLGATDPRHPEIQVRLSLWTLTAERMRCRCSF